LSIGRLGVVQSEGSNDLKKNMKIEKQDKTKELFLKQVSILNRLEKVVLK
tara:strand:+ start:383 stop:532 length:150 start_codon:yes stop_codon:yes gene_type:complete